MNELIYRQDAIEGICKEWCGCDEDRIKRCNADPHRGEYDEEYDSDKFHCDGCDDVVVIRELPSAQPEYEELTPEEAASEIASGSIMSARYWLDAMIRLKQMGYAICRKR